MKSKILVLGAMMFSSALFAANNNAVELSNEIFAMKKSASTKELAIKDMCLNAHSKMLDMTKNMNQAQKDDFYKEFKMQMRKNMATLGKDEYFNPKICKKYINSNGIGNARNNNYNNSNMRNAKQNGNGMGNNRGNMRHNSNCVNYGDCPNR